MVTYEAVARFQREFAKLTAAQKKLCRAAFREFAEDLRRHPGKFRPSLRVKRVAGAVGIYEMTWAPDGRCTFEYGPEVRPGEGHIIWRRCGTHSIFQQP